MLPDDNTLSELVRNTYSAFRMILLMPVDPVCGIELEEEMAVSLIHNGKSYFFCCEGCKGIFIRKPKRYAKKRPM